MCKVLSAKCVLLIVFSARVNSYFKLKKCFIFFLFLCCYGCYVRLCRFIHDIIFKAKQKLNRIWLTILLYFPFCAP